jgi:hypothetical protein
MANNTTSASAFSPVDSVARIAPLAFSSFVSVVFIVSCVPPRSSSMCMCVRRSSSKPRSSLSLRWRMRTFEPSP